MLQDDRRNVLVAAYAVFEENGFSYITNRVLIVANDSPYADEGEWGKLDWLMPTEPIVVTDDAKYEIKKQLRKWDIEID